MLGCGPAPAAPDSGASDGGGGDAGDGFVPVDMAPADGPSVIIAINAVELHGVTGTAPPAPVMQADIEINARSTDFIAQFSEGRCSASAFSGTGPMPPRIANIGEVQVTGYSGDAGGDLTQRTTACTFGALGYGCNFPIVMKLESGFFPDPGGAAHWLMPADVLQIQIAGGPDAPPLTNRMQIADTAATTVSAFSGAVDGTSCSGGAATQLEGSGAAAFPLDSDLLIKVRCTRRDGLPTACGMLRVSMRASGSQPSDFAIATCSSAQASCVRVPAQALAKLAFAGWLRIQTYVTATTTPIVEDLPHNAFFSSGQGQRYLRTP